MADEVDWGEIERQLKHQVAESLTAKFAPIFKRMDEEIVFGISEVTPLHDPSNADLVALLKELDFPVPDGNPSVCDIWAGKYG